MSQLMVSGGADSKVIIWNVKSKTSLAVINMGCSVAQVRTHADSSMVGVALDDFTLAIVDLETKRKVRQFPGIPHLMTLAIIRKCTM